MTTNVLAERTAAGASAVAPIVVHHRKAEVDGIGIFYREAGPADAPVVLLLHGFPTSSHMFRNLIPHLADQYRVIAPDYPGYGQSDSPDRATFAYTFDSFARLVDRLLEQLGIAKFAMYVMDYGAGGWRYRTPRGLPASSSKTAMPMTKGSRRSGTLSKLIGRRVLTTRGRRWPSC